MDAAQFELVWDSYKDRLLAFIRSKASRPEDAEDLLQEVFLRVHTGLCCLPPRASFERWVYRVARNLIIDRYRSRRDCRVLEDEPESPYGRAELEDDPAARIAFSLREMVDSLPEPYRGALIASEYEGMTRAEYADTAGITLAAAKSRILRARGKLKDALLACCHFELDSLGGIVDYEPRCAACDLRRAAAPTGRRP